MQTAETAKASERAWFVGLLSLGGAAASSALVSEGTSAVAYVLLGLLIVGAALAGLHKRIHGFLHRLGGRWLAGFLAVFVPLGGTVVFALYPVGIGFALAVGVPLDAKFIVVAAVSSVLCLANLAALVVNTAAILGNRQSRS